MERPELLRALPPEELYLSVLEIGPDDAAELVAMSTPAQFRHFVDMAAWHGPEEGPRTAEVIRWLRLAREGADDLEKFRKQLWSLDIELLALVLRREQLPFEAESGIGGGGGEEDAVVRLRDGTQADGLAVVVRT